MSKWRPLTWVILVFNALMLIWLLSALVSTGNATNDCAGEQFVDACETGTAIGGGIAFVAILLIWALGDVILGVIWMVTRKNDSGTPAIGTSYSPTKAGTTRSCPFCAEQIQNAATVCRHCGRDVPVGEAPAFPADHCQNCGASPARPPTATCLACGSPMVKSPVL